MPTVHQRYKQTDGQLTRAIPRFALRALRSKNEIRMAADACMFGSKIEVKIDFVMSFLVSVSNIIRTGAYIL